MSQLEKSGLDRQEWHIVLASMSPRREELLKFLKLPFEIMPSHVDETMDPEAPPGEMVVELARQKAQEIFNRLRETQLDHRRLLVIGADTTVYLDGLFYNKPESKEHAFEMLSELSGRCHEVYTGVAIARADGKEGVSHFTDFVTSRVYFRIIEPAEIRAYIETVEPMDKAGAYALQGTGSMFVEKIDGCFTNVIGLPIPKVVTLLRQAGMHILGI